MTVEISLYFRCKRCNRDVEVEAEGYDDSFLVHPCNCSEKDDIYWKSEVAKSIGEYAKKIMFAKEGEDV